jgi:hypothetical protein
MWWYQYVLAACLQAGVWEKQGSQSRQMRGSINTCSIPSLCLKTLVFVLTSFLQSESNDNGSSTYSSSSSRFFYQSQITQHWWQNYLEYYHHTCNSSRFTPLSPTKCTMLFPDILYNNIMFNTPTRFNPLWDHHKGITLTLTFHKIELAIHVHNKKM